MLACSQNNMKGAKILLSFGANIDLINASGCSALHISAYAGHLDVFSLLIQNGARYDLRDHTGKTALEVLFEKHSKREIKSTFKKAE
uniref:ANK_REP_REGION domain-containing protein n=1 Tax=Mesocestoides corti TaxID=53468 RepID=A0A5K3ELW5_MESCO